MAEAEPPGRREARAGKVHREVVQHPKVSLSLSVVGTCSGPRGTLAQGVRATETARDEAAADEGKTKSFGRIETRR